MFRHAKSFDSIVAPGTKVGFAKRKKAIARRARTSAALGPFLSSQDDEPRQNFRWKSTTISSQKKEKSPRCTCRQSANRACPVHQPSESPKVSRWDSNTKDQHVGLDVPLRCNSPKSSSDDKRAPQRPVRKGGPPRLPKRINSDDGTVVHPKMPCARAG